MDPGDTNLSRKVSPHKGSLMGIWAVYLGREETVMSDGRVTVAIGSDAYGCPEPAFDGGWPVG